MRAVLERDFLSTVSRGRAFLLRSLVAAAVAAAGMLVLQANRRLFADHPDEGARLVFAGGACALLCLLFLLAPPTTVGSILGERERGTLPLVLSSPVGPRSLAAAKVVSRCMALLAWAMAASVPLATTILLGGVALSQVADLGMTCAGLVVELAAWGVWVSSVTTRLATGAVLAFVLPVARWALFLLPLGLFAVDDAPLEDRLPDPTRRAALWMVAGSTPFPAAVRTADPRQYDREVARGVSGPSTRVGVGWMVRNGVAIVTTPGPAPTPSPPPSLLFRPAETYLFSSLAGALLAVLLAGRRLGREEEPREGLVARLLARRRALRLPPGEGNPVAWKEQRLLNTAASRPLYYAVLALLVAGEAAYLLGCGTVLRHTREMMEAGVGLAAAQASLVGLVAVIAGAAAMAHERSVGTLDLLRASPLEPREIVRGKLQGLLRGVGLLALLPLAHLGLLAATRIVDPLTALGAAALLGTFLLFFSMAGMTAGLAARRTGPAVVRGALLFGALLAGIPLLAVLLADGFGQKRAAEVLLAGCPPATMYLALEGSLRLLHAGWREAFWIGSGVLGREHRAALAWCAAYGAAAVLAWAAAPRLLALRFEREREEG